jgi:hypothetical protein
MRSEKFSGRKVSRLGNTDYTQFDWGHPNKISYRQRNIIDQYCRFLGNSVPPDFQYWTLCGANHKPGAEFDQITNSGLVKASQFHGVDNDPLIIQQNSEYHPSANWYCGDFVDVLHRQAHWKPAIIHVDTINMTRRASNLAKGVIYRIEECSFDWPVMIVFNYILKRAIHEIRDDPMDFVAAIAAASNKPWQPIPEIYVYKSVASEYSRAHLASFTAFFGNVANLPRKVCSI